MRETGKPDHREQTSEVGTIIRKFASEETNVPRPRGCSVCGRGRRLRLRGAKIGILAFAASLLFSSVAEAATCLTSAEEVRKVSPKAWPKWTYGPNREQCWYSGKKPVFAKAPPSQAPVARAPMPQATTETPLQEDYSSAEPVKQPWALEYRWSDRFEIRHQARDEPLTYWVGDDEGYDLYGAGRPPRPSQ